jgi:prolyl 4-hydroxylase
MTATQQPITDALRTWIVAQAQAGCKPEDVLDAMRAAGWDDEVALVAFEDTLTQHLDGHHRQAMALPPAVPVPEPDLGHGAASLWAVDREVRVLMTLRSPRVVVFGGLLADDECDELMTLARQRLVRSETVDTTTGGSEVNGARTSVGMFFDRGEHPVCTRVEQRIAALLRWPMENGEGLQILRYGPGAEYQPHHDYFDPAQPGTPNILKRGGQRVGTLIMYLNAPATGGATIFPDAGLEIAPIKGNGVFFSYDRPHPMTRTLHGGAPVVEGEKWVATKWLRERRFV